ncbi:hypothetical protein GCM10023143_25100 [Compostibacter hankyongensis]|uniref:DUF4252 domain-containing protein n=2 Tax=Compostibacter hankyongensis TaxID=1007089 RepID=A0ABP8FZP7_9BACT
MMNNTLLAFLFFSFFIIASSSCAQNTYVIDNKIIKEIKIEHVDIGIETPMNVSCKGFEAYFQSQIKAEKVLAIREINDISKITNDFLSSAKKYSDPPDVRVKIIFIQKDGTEQTLCVGRLVSSYKGINFINTKNFIPDILKGLNKK